MLNLEKYLDAQRKEIDTYIWGKGEELHHNPIEDKSRDDWGCEWIEKFAASFAKYHRAEYEIA